MITIDMRAMEAMQTVLMHIPRQVERAAEMALDKTAMEARDAIVEEMKDVFENPTPFTLNSVKVRPTQNHNMEAVIWFASPTRMHDSYLAPQVEGGYQKQKGFERALEMGPMLPAMGAKLDRYGNISAGQVRQILSVLGRAERGEGHSANRSDRSARRNTRERDYVLIHQRRGNLYPGVYQRFQTSAGFGARTRREFADRSRAYQRGRSRHGFTSVVRARGLRPVFLQAPVRPVERTLDAPYIVQKTVDERFEPLFWEQLTRVRG